MNHTTNLSMGRMRRSVLGAAILSSLFVPSLASAFSFTDGNMFNLFYAKTEYQAGAGGTTSTSGNSLGNPGNARTVVHTVAGSSGTSRVGASHIATQSLTTTPPTGFLSVDMGIDAQLLTSSTIQIGRLAFVVEQNGTLFASDTITWTGNGWTGIFPDGLFEQDFEQINFQTSTYRNSGVNPDFDLAGSSLRFGFLTWAESSSLDAQSVTMLFDNFNVNFTANPVPEPATLSVLALAALARRRRLRSA